MMSDDIVNQLKDFAATLKRGEGRSTVYGAASEIERLRVERDRWAKWGEHVFTCPNKGINPCHDCVSPATADAMSRVDRGGAW